MHGLSDQEKKAHAAPAEVADLRAATYKRVAGRTFNEYSLLTTCALLDRIAELEYSSNEPDLDIPAIDLKYED